MLNTVKESLDTFNVNFLTSERMDVYQTKKYTCYRVGSLLKTVKSYLASSKQLRISYLVAPSKILFCGELFSDELVTLVLPPVGVVLRETIPVVVVGGVIRRCGQLVVLQIHRVLSIKQWISYYIRYYPQGTPINFT